MSKKRNVVNLLVEAGVRKQRFMEQCEICKSYFRGKYELKEHIAIQHNNERYICDFESCKKEFRSLNGWKNHMINSHKKDVEGQKKCEVCCKNFVFLGQLNDHKRSTHNANKIKCSICQAQFVYESSYHRHCLSCDGETFSSKKLRCSICNKKFNKIRYVRDHIQGQHHPARYACKNCGQKFKYRSALAYHRKTKHADR